MTASPDANGLSVFNINSSALFGNNKVQQIELITNNSTNIVINVAGTAVNWVAGNMVGDLTQNSWRERVVWNFYEATSIDFKGKNMNGQVLAPYADVKAAGPIDGSIFAKSLATTGEVHLPGYKGTIGFSPVPEPSSAGLLLLGATAALLRRKRIS